MVNLGGRTRTGKNLLVGVDADQTKPKLKLSIKNLRPHNFHPKCTEDTQTQRQPHIERCGVRIFDKDKKLNDCKFNISMSQKVPLAVLYVIFDDPCKTISAWLIGQYRKVA